MLSVSMSQKSSRDKFLGERFCEPVTGVTTLRSNCALVVSLALILVCDLVWPCWGTGEANIGWDKFAGILFSTALAGALESPGV
jgi:hypothetical protein